MPTGPGSSVEGRTKVSIDQLINEQVVSGKVEDSKLILITREGAEIFAGDVATGGGGGSGGFQTRTFSFPMAANDWVIPHNLSAPVKVEIFDANGKELLTTVTYSADMNTAYAHFYYPTSGTARATS